MNIVHYLLGFPPMRSGGLTKYAIDLMLTERQMGHKVYALVPGNFRMKSTRSKLVKTSAYKEIEVFRLTNALPVPLLYGISAPGKFMGKRQIQGFEEFLVNTKADVLHLHTLMGLPIELIQLFKDKGVRIVYTSHDYFGLCLKVNFVDHEGKFCNNATPQKCMNCCKLSPSLPFLWARNLPVIGTLKKFIK